MSAFHLIKRKRRKGGKVAPDRTYTGRYHIEPWEPWKSVALGVTDKQVAEKKMRELIERIEKERAGLVLPADQVIAANRSLVELLADFVQDHKARGHNRKYTDNLEARCRRLIAECEWKHLRDVTVASFTQWRAVGPKARGYGHKKAKPMSAKTLNDYLAAVSSFMNWLKDRGQVAVNPLENVKSVDARGRETYTRRALTAEEVQRLLAVAGDRSVLYRFAIETGFRRDAIYRLPWSRLHLDVDEPYVDLVSINSKNRRQQRQPISHTLRLELLQWRAKCGTPGGRVFRGLLPSCGTEFLQSDTAAAGIPWEDANDEKIDFHALRHTAATLAGQQGVGVATLQAFTNHKTTSQLQRYLHGNEDHVRGVVNRIAGAIDHERVGTHSGTHIGTHNTGSHGRFGTRTGTNAGRAKNAETPIKPAKNPASLVASQGSVQVTPAGFEPTFSG